MIKIRLYLYDSTKEALGYRGTELTEYLITGVQNTEDITQVVDLSEVTLVGYPSRVAFAPETKMILDEEEEEGITVRTFHRVVKDDAVTQTVLSKQYFEHAITLAEPSIVTQKRLVDNIAITYKLKDVTLETQTTIDIDIDSGFKNPQTSGKPTKSAGKTALSLGVAYYAFKWFYFSGVPQICNADDYSTYHSEKKYNDFTKFSPTEGVGRAKITLPTLYVYALNNGSTSDYTTIPVVMDYVVTGRKVGESVYSKVASGTIIPKFASLANVGCASSDGQWLLEDSAKDTGSYVGSSPKLLYKKYVSSSQTTSPVYETAAFDVRLDYEYELQVYLGSLSGTPPTNNSEVYTGDDVAESFDYTYVAQYGGTNYTVTKARSSAPQDTYKQTATFVIYGTENPHVTLASGVPYTCENLIKKAFLNSMLKPRQLDAAVGQLGYVNSNNELAYDCPFYIDPAFTQKLSLTQVNEIFFNQKNLWEVLIEAGHYIHAIPELVFGQNDKFMLTFNELGSTNEKSLYGEHVSITNFQGVDDYICEINSYITNYVQLGGQITEWAAAKTTDETYLVSNDTAELVVSFPITELIDVQIKANADYDTEIKAGEVANATQYFYEKNVYQILSVKYNDYPNKGVAMYYSLGDNKIIGGDYQLPQANANQWSEYAIKKIIYWAFHGDYQSTLTGNPWKDIKVNDFSFRITYRTKSSVRQSHTRPDIRKFLVNSKFDETPQHRQIANQTETLVDSEKYGSNMYGTLLKTGNNEYENELWFSSVYELPRKGDLTRINGDIYYVAKVVNRYFPNHIESKVTYSKDYNELSKIIGIPSEPRFYEISEQSSIDRHVSIDDYLLITTDSANFSPNNADGYLEDVSHLKTLVLGGNAAFAKYVVAAFKGDADVGSNSGTFGEENLYIEVMSPLNAYSSGNTLTYSWTMADNFSAGDKVGETVEFTGGTAADNAYRSLAAVRYTDKYGKATLFDFFIIEDYSTLSADQINALPESPLSAKNDTLKEQKILATNVDVDNTDYNRRGLILLKDCRERLIFNYNLRYITDSDRFVSSPFFFTPKANTVKLALLSSEVNKLSSGYFSTGEVMTVIDIPTSAITETNGTDAYGQTKPVAFALKVSNLISDTYFTESGVPKFKAIALVSEYDSQTYSTQFILARNIDETMTKDEARADWNFGVPKNTFFSHRQ